MMIMASQAVMFKSLQKLTCYFKTSKIVHKICIVFYDATCAVTAAKIENN